MHYDDVFESPRALDPPGAAQAIAFTAPEPGGLRHDSLWALVRDELEAATWRASSWSMAGAVEESRTVPIEAVGSPSCWWVAPDGNHCCGAVGRSVRCWSLMEDRVLWTRSFDDEVLRFTASDDGALLFCLGCSGEHAAITIEMWRPGRFRGWTWSGDAPAGGLEAADLVANQKGRLLRFRVQGRDLVFNGLRGNLLRDQVNARPCLDQARTRSLIGLGRGGLLAAYAAGLDVPRALDEWLLDPRPFAPDGAYRLAARQSGVEVLDVVTGEPLAVLPGCSEAVRDVCVAPTGRWLAALTGSGRIMVWRVNRS